MAHLDRKPSITSLNDIKQRFRKDNIPLVPLQARTQSKTYGEWGLSVMQKLPPPQEALKPSILKDLFKIGHEDCFLWVKWRMIDRTEKNPFVVEPSSMEAVAAAASRFSDDSPTRTTWKTIPDWFLIIYGGDYQAAFDDWKLNVPELVTQFYIIYAQQFLIKGTNIAGKSHPNPYYESWNDYVGGPFEEMNFILRNAPEYDNEMCMDSSQVNYLQMLQWIITLMPGVNSDITCYRYSRSTVALNAASEGDELTFKGYSSVSMNILKTINIVNWKAVTAKNPQPMIMMKLMIPAGSRFLVVPSEENEIILPHYCKFQAKLIMKLTSSITYIELELMNDPTLCSRNKNGL